MIAEIIELCAKHRALVLVVVLVAAAGAIAAIRQVKLDAIPDLSDPQVIVFTEWKGRSPTLVEDQVTYPIASALARRAEGHGRARLLDVRDVVRLRPLRGGHRRLLGALARARVPLDARATGSPRASTPSSAPTRPASAGSTSTRSSTTAASTISPSSARSRTSRSATRSRACPASPQVASVGGYEKQYQVTVDPDEAPRLRRHARATSPTAVRGLERRGRRPRRSR